MKEGRRKGATVGIASMVVKDPLKVVIQAGDGGVTRLPGRLLLQVWWLIHSLPGSGIWIGEIYGSVDWWEGGKGNRAEVWLSGRRIAGCSTPYTQSE